MKQKIYQVDAFTNKVFSGNPAAVCPLDEWLDDDILQKIANENNLSETAFYVKQADPYELRWFTPTVEVDLCGHATLAAAFVLFNHENHKGNTIQFYSPRSGILTVTKEGELLTMNFPADMLKEAELSEQIRNCFDIQPQLAIKGRMDYLLIFAHEEEIRNMVPAFDAISRLDARGVCVSAQGKESDFVSRFFAPQAGINEDPVTGSAHTALTQYWSKRLAKTELTAIQLSPRKGYLQCRYLNDRVEITGQARLYLFGEIYL